MTMSGRTRILAVLGAVVTLSLSGPAYAGEQHAPKAASAPKVAATPVVGECHKMTVKQGLAKSDKTPVIDCSKAHNTRVIAVQDLPGGATYDDLTAAKLYRVADKICEPAVRANVAHQYRVLDRTAYDYVFFRPNKAQRADGARWLRCDLTLLRGRSFGNLPTDRVPAVEGGSIPNSVKRCLTGKNFIVTTCASSHTHRATGAFTIASKKYPGQKKMIAIGQKRCPAFVTTRYMFYSWKVMPFYASRNDHTMVCYSRTKH